MDSPVTAKVAILQALVRGEAYGLEIAGRIEALTDGRVRLGAGSLYPALRELEREGLLLSYEADPAPERGGRPRRYYRLTGDASATINAQRVAVAGLFNLTFAGETS